MGEIRLLTIIVVLVAGCVVPAQNEATNTFTVFCPKDNCEERVAMAIANAHVSVHVAMYSFTSEEISDALISAKNRGVDVKVVLDYLQSASKSSSAKKLENNLVPLRILKGQGSMHNKFTVIDNQLAITGSFNFTTNADERNNENIVFIFSQETAQEFEGEFLRLWVEAG